MARAIQSATAALAESWALRSHPQPPQHPQQQQPPQQQRREYQLGHPMWTQDASGLACGRDGPGVQCVCGSDAGGAMLRACTVARALATLVETVRDSVPGGPARRAPAAGPDPGSPVPSALGAAVHSAVAAAMHAGAEAAMAVALVGAGEGLGALAEIMGPACGGAQGTWTAGPGSAGVARECAAVVLALTGAHGAATETVLNIGTGAVYSHWRVCHLQRPPTTEVPAVRWAQLVHQRDREDDAARARAAKEALSEDCDDDGGGPGATHIPASPAGATTVAAAASLFACRYLGSICYTVLSSPVTLWDSEISGQGWLPRLRSMRSATVELTRRVNNDPEVSNSLDPDNDDDPANLGTAGGNASVAEGGKFLLFS
jgi:hypothetical protein